MGWGLADVGAGGGVKIWSESGTSTMIKGRDQEGKKMIEICIRFARGAIMHRRAIEGVRKRQKGCVEGKGGLWHCKLDCFVSKGEPEGWMQDQAQYVAEEDPWMAENSTRNRSVDVSVHALTVRVNGA